MVEGVRNESEPGTFECTGMRQTGAKRVDPRHLELLRALQMHGSITAVADLQLRSPSAVSQQLRTASRSLGVEVVRPAGRGIELTEAGKFLASAGERVATTLAQVQADWDDYRSEPTGTVRVAALTSAAAIIFPQLLREHADTALRIDAHDVDVAESAYSDLTRDFDLVIGHTLSLERPQGSHRLWAQPVGTEPLDVAMRQGHPLAGRDVLRPDDVAGAAWIGVPEGYPFDDILKTLARVTGSAPHVRQRLRDNRLIEAIVRGGDELAILPRYTTPSNTGLRLVPLAGVSAHRTIWALAQPDQAARLSVRSVVESAARIMGERAQV